MWRWNLTLSWCFVAALWMGMPGMPGMPGCLAPRLITLDSTNTLLRLRRPVGELYLQSLRKVPGVAVSAADLGCRFRVAIARQSQRSPSFGAAEQGCRAWWRKVVAETLEGAGVGADHKDFEGIFQHLYELFAGQEAWELFPHTRSTLDSLRHWCNRNSCRLGVLSNMDDRLEMILEELGIRDCFDFVLTSYAAGAEKPSSEIFTKAMAAMAYGEVLEPQHCLHCGDSKQRDLSGALRSGWCAVLLDETAKRTEEIEMAPLSVHQSAWKMPDLSHLPSLLKMPEA